MSSRQRTLGHAAALMTILIWGTTFVSTKVLLRDFTPVTVLFTRFVIGYAFLWCLKPRFLPFSGWKKEFLFAGAGLTGVTLYFLPHSTEVQPLFPVKRSRGGRPVFRNSGFLDEKSRPEAAVSSEQGGEADGARTRDLQRDRLAL